MAPSLRYFGSIAALLCIAAARPAPAPGITPAPMAHMARQYSNTTTTSPSVTSAPPITSCALTSEAAFTLDGQSYPATIACACNDGWTAGINTVVGDDGNTSYDCAVGTTTTMVVSVETPAPTPTWHIKVDAGESSFLVGDVDQSTLEGIFGAECGPDICDGGSPAEFTFRSINSAGHTADYPGQFVVTGNADGNQAMIDAMLASINQALLGTSQCSDKPATQCMNDAKRDPETPGIALDCGQIELTQCTLANYIQATTYDPDGKQMGQITLAGSSEDPEPFSCEDFLDPIESILGNFELPPLAEGAMTIASFACGLIDDATGASDD